MQTIATLARFCVLEALRTRLGLLALALLVVGLGFSWLAGQVAITETRQIQAALMSSFLRFAAVLVVAAFVVISQVRESADKGQEMLLSLATPRSAYYLGKALGFAAVAWLLALLLGLPLLLYAPVKGVVIWTVSLGMELSIVATASLFFVTTLGQLPAALAAVAGFYLLSRAMAALRLIGGSTLLDDKSAAHAIVQWTLEAIAVALPRLDLFTQSAWLTAQEAPASTLGALALQAAIYTALLTAAGLVDFQRKNF